MLTFNISIILSSFQIFPFFQFGRLCQVFFSSHFSLLFIIIRFYLFFNNTILSRFFSFEFYHLNSYENNIEIEKKISSYSSNLYLYLEKKKITFYICRKSASSSVMLETIKRELSYEKKHLLLLSSASYYISRVLYVRYYITRAVDRQYI